MKPFKRTTTALSVLLLGLAIIARFYPQVIDRAIAYVEPVEEGVSQHVTLVPNSVQDGNSFRVRNEEGREIKVKLCGVDSPALEQPLGSESRDHLQSLIAQGSDKVILIATDIERNNHTIADVFIPTATPTADGVEEIHLNSQMIADGMAYVHPQHVDDCPNAQAMKIAEDGAREKSLGVWHSGIDQKP